MDGGYLQDLVSRQERISNEKKCVNSALAIRKLIGAHRDGLTLRRAPFLLPYSVYSAVVAILRPQSKEDAEPFKEAISFFWKALCELQRGCNFGLRKPVSIIREMMSELGESVPQSLDHPENGTAMSRMMDMYSFGNAVPISTSVHPDLGNQQSSNMNFDQSTPGFLDFLDDQERTITDDTLYRLFAQQSGFFSAPIGLHPIAMSIVSERSSPISSCVRHVVNFCARNLPGPSEIWLRSLVPDPQSPVSDGSLPLRAPQPIDLVIEVDAVETRDFCLSI